MKARVDSKSSWVIAGACFWISFCTDGVFRSHSIYFDSILDNFEVRRDTAAWPFSLSGVMYSLGVSVSGLLNKVTSIRNQLLLCIVMSSLGMGLNYFARNVTTIILSYGILFGLFTGQLYGARSIMVARAFDRYRISAMGIMNAGSSVGTFVFPHVLIALVRKYMLRDSFLLTSVIIMQALLGAVMCFKASDFEPAKELPKDEVEQNNKDIETQNIPDSKETVSKNTLIKVLRKLIEFLSVTKDPMLYIITLTYLMFFFSFVPFLTVIFEYGKDKGLSESQASFLPSVFAISDLFGRLVIGIIMDTLRIRRRNAQMVVFITAGLVYVLITLFTGSIMTNVLVGCAGLLSGSILTMEFPTFTQYFGVDKLPAAIAVSNVPMALIQLAVPPLIGYYRDVLKSYDFLMYTFAGLHGFAGVLWILEPWATTTKCKTNEQTDNEKELTRF